MAERWWQPRYLGKQQRCTFIAMLVHWSCWQTKCVHNGHVLQNEEALLMPPVEFRASGEQEPTPDLQHPVFDSDTLPLLFSSAWQENFGEL
jgi:hypothetical protein